MSTYQTTHQEIYNRYHETDNVVTKRSYLDILKRRANNGSKEAKEAKEARELVSKIERALCAT